MYTKRSFFRIKNSAVPIILGQDGLRSLVIQKTNKKHVQNVVYLNFPYHSKRQCSCVSLYMAVGIVRRGFVNFSFFAQSQFWGEMYA